jgi:nucleoside-diphosphate-sugar epimerase
VNTWLVTGCAGFIGSHLTDRLIDQGDRVIGIDRFSDFYPREAKELNLRRARRSPRFELLEWNISEPPGIESDTLDYPRFNWRDVDGVFHMAAQPGVRGSWADGFMWHLHDNIGATQQVFETCLRQNQPVVYASSSSVYGDQETWPTREDAELRPRSPYGVTKATCELLARTYHTDGLASIGLRYFTVYGPRQRPDMAFYRMIQSVLDYPDKGAFAVYGDGLQSRDFTYVSDAVEATVLAMGRLKSNSVVERLVLNVGGGEEATLARALDLVGAELGEPVECFSAGVQRGDVRRTAADCALAKLRLGWEPQVGLEFGLSNQVRWSRAWMKEAEAESESPDERRVRIAAELLRDVPTEELRRRADEIKRELGE